VTWVWAAGILLVVKREKYQMLIGYARTSTTDQVAGLEAQEASLAATGCKIIKERKSPIEQRGRLAALPGIMLERDSRRPPQDLSRCPFA